MNCLTCNSATEACRDGCDKGVGFAKLLAGIAIAAFLILFGALACTDNEDSASQGTSGVHLAPPQQVNDTPEPQTAAEMYVAQLNSIAGMPLVDSSKAIPAGYKICGFIDTGFSTQSIVAGIQQENPLTFDQALAVIEAAKTYLCGDES